jgi:hypothetical protein
MYSIALDSGILLTRGVTATYTALRTTLTNATL